MYFIISRILWNHTWSAILFVQGNLAKYTHLSMMWSININKFVVSIEYMCIHWDCVSHLCLHILHWVCCFCSYCYFVLCRHINSSTNLWFTEAKLFHRFLLSLVWLILCFNFCHDSTAEWWFLRGLCFVVAFLETAWRKNDVLIPIRTLVFYCCFFFFFLSLVWRTL